MRVYTDNGMNGFREYIYTGTQNMESYPNGDMCEVSSNCAESGVVANSGIFTYVGYLSRDGEGYTSKIIYAEDTTDSGFLRLYIAWADTTGLNDGDAAIIGFRDAANQIVCYLSIGQDQTLKLHKQDGTQIGNKSGIALEAGKFHMLELQNSPGGTIGRIEGRLDGKVFAGGDNSATGNWSKISFGCLNSVGLKNQVCFDSIALNINSGSEQNGYPGEGKIIEYSPTLDMGINQWSASDAPAGHNSAFRVMDSATYNNLRTNGYIESNTMGQKEEFAINNLWEYHYSTAYLDWPEISSNNPSDDNYNISLININYIHRTSTAATTAPKFVIRLKTDNPIEDFSTGPITATKSDQFDFVMDKVILYKKPGTNRPWSISDIKKLKIELELVEAGSHPVQVGRLWLTLEYKANPKQNFLPLLL